MTTTKTCKDLYETNSVFREMVDAWIEHRWCPAEMQDVLLEERLDHAADCAKWCYEKEERNSSGTWESKCRTYPWHNPKSLHWYVTNNTGSNSDCNMVPFNNLPGEKEGNLIFSESITKAILALLDIWRIVETTNEGEQK